MIASLSSTQPVGPATSMAVALPLATVSRAVDRRLYAHRQARTAAGVVLVVASLLLAGNAIARGQLLGVPVHAAAVLGGGWLAAALAAALAFVVASARANLQDIGRLADRHLAGSLAWPVAGLALILPLTLHQLIAQDRGASFDDWVVWSLLLVGHSHVALALMGARRMTRLVRNERALTPAAIYGITVGIAMVPGGILMLVPPILVAMTGLVFLFILWIPEKVIARERRLLAV